ncbi:MAG: DUF2066 domain-containing protein [Gammaproteobacteria bacterium]
MRNFRAGWVLVGAILAFAPVGARAATEVYAAATPVPDQSADARSQAFARDLAAVFVKVSGNLQVTQVAGLAATLAQADKLVLEYRYRQASAGGGLELWAHFDQKAVNAALAAAGQPVWGGNRPTVIVWLLTPAGIVGDDPANPVAAALHKAAAERGVPLILPLLDLADQQQVSAFDIRSFFLSALKTASQRYGTQTMLVGSVTAAADRSFTSQWQLTLGQTTTPFASTGASPQAAAAAGVEQAATLLAQEFAYLPTSAAAGDLLLKVDGIANFETEVAVRRIVAGVQGVKNLRLARIAGARVAWRVSYAGTAEDFARRLALAGGLTRLAMSPAVPASVMAPAAATRLPELDFRYTP